MHSQALNLLHEMNYNFTKARFFVMFPYYLSYNRYRTNNPISISDEEMESKITEHLESLRNCKSKELQRWTEQLTAMLETRVNIVRINQLIEQGKQNKFEVPESIKEQIERATKLGKDLRKLAGSKMTMDRLLQRRESLTEQNIITNEITSFEETVNRCETWINKANEFENECFLPLPLFSEDQEPTLQRELDPALPHKIEFRAIALLVQEYNNLPVLHPPFEANTRRLYDATNELLDRLPQFSKAARTRTNTPSKFSYTSILHLLEEVRLHPVLHPDFESFERQAHEAMELLERSSMCLEDSRFDKNLKSMAGLVKLVGDLPISTNITAKLESYVEYVNLVERIRRDIVYPQRFESTQQLLIEALKKGISSTELEEFQVKLNLYRGWHQSTQLIKEAESSVVTLVEIIKHQDRVLAGIVDESLFKSQFDMARRQLNFEPALVEEYNRKLQQLQEEKLRVRELLSYDEPDLQQLIDQLLRCCRCGLKHPEFMQLLARVRSYLTSLCKMLFILELYQYDSEDRAAYFLKKEEHEELFGLLASRRELKDFDKADGEQLLAEATQRPFPRRLLQYRKFKLFMQDSADWEQLASEFIRRYDATGEFEMEVLEGLLSDTSNILYSAELAHRLQDINNVSRWKHSIESKLEDEVLPNIFSEDDLVAIAATQQQMQTLQRTAAPDNLKQQALEYLRAHADRLSSLMSKISTIHIEKTHKLPQLTKLMKEIDRLTINDAKLTQLRLKFTTEISSCEAWKERCIQIRRADHKRHQDKPQEQEEAGERRRANEFGYYFKLPLLLVELNNASSLKIVLEELSKLKNLIQETHGFMQRARQFLRKERPPYSELVALEQEGSKLNIFCVEFQVVRRKCEYVNSWKNMANNVIDSMIILRLEQLKVMKPQELIADHLPTERKQLPSVTTHDLELEAAQVEEDAERSETFKPAIVAPVDPTASNKRKRKQNPLYNNDDITLLIEEMYSPKLKKPRKKVSNEGVTRRMKLESRKHNKNEQMLKQVEDYYENPAVYCICRMGLMNETSMMVQCEQCEEWFHTECVGIRKSYVKNVKEYYCVACSKFSGKRMDYQDSFYWESHVKLSEVAFDRLVKEGEELGVTMDEITRLQQIQGKVRSWKHTVAKAIARHWNNAGESTDESSQRTQAKLLFELYLQSFWLPTLHLQTDMLRCFLTPHR